MGDQLDRSVGENGDAGQQTHELLHLSAVALIAGENIGRRSDADYLRLNVSGSLQQLPIESGGLDFAAWLTVASTASLPAKDSR